MNEKLRKILIILCILVLVAAAGFIIRSMVLNQQKQELDQQVRDLYDGEIPRTETSAQLPAAAEPTESAAVTALIPPAATAAAVQTAAVEQTAAAVQTAAADTLAPDNGGILLAASAETAAAADAGSAGQTAIPAAEAAPAETSALPAARAAAADAATETAAPAETDPSPESSAPAGTSAPAEDTSGGDALSAGELDAFGRPFHQAEDVEIPPVHPDFAKLLEANEDTIGWLKLPDMVDLPVMYRDNDYYLDYNFFRQKDTNGTLFLNMHNYLIPRDDVLLIHGHHMTSTGAMFGLLPRYGQLDYVRTHPLAYFRTIYDAADQVYVPVAAFTASMKEDEVDFYDIMQLSFPSLPGAPADGTDTLRNSPAFQQYLREIATLSKWASPVDVNVDDQLLMLVTCVSEHNDGRFMLVLRRLRPGETEEGIRALFSPEKETPAP